MLHALVTYYLDSLLSGLTARPPPVGEAGTGNPRNGCRLVTHNSRLAQKLAKWAETQLKLPGRSARPTWLYSAWKVVTG